jgi:hypothetical protein
MDDQKNKPALIPIDPPFGPYSSPGEIRQWIRELESMPQVPFVPESLEEARHWLSEAAQRKR